MQKIDFLSEYDDGLNNVKFELIDENELYDSIINLNKKICDLGKDENEVDEIVKEIEKVVEKYKNYLNIKKIADYSEGIYVIPPRTIVSVNVNTYCLDSNAAAPSKEEPYILTKSEPEIPLFKEIMKYTNSKYYIKKSLKQHLLWNLKNNVIFEALSKDERDLLLSIDSVAYLKVNSQIKQTTIDLFKNLIPEINKVEKINTIIKGKVYKYEEYAQNIERLVSKFEMPKIEKPIKSDGYNLYTIIKPNSFSNARITFINTSKDEVKIHYGYFRPLREDVQPLAFDLPEFDEKLYDKIKKAFAELEISSLNAYGKYTDMPFKLEEGDKLLIEKYPNRLVDFWKAFQDRNKALKMTMEFCKQYPDLCNNNMYNDKGDAFRHAIWNAFMQRDIGEFTIDIANGHELSYNINEAERKMDMNNNKIGREIGQKLKDANIFDDKAYYDEILKNIERLRSIK